MEQFRYYVKDNNGEARTGLIEAVNIRQASVLLHERGLIVIKLVPKQKGLDIAQIVSNMRPISLSDLSSFTRQLSTMVSSGLSLVDTMLLLEKQTLNPRLKNAISEIIRDVQGGSNLSYSMAKNKGVFSNTYISMIKAAESSGNLDQILEKLAESLENEREFRSKVIGALIYPAFLLSVTIVVMIVVTVYVLPKLKNLLESSNVPLPLPTLIMLSLSDIMSKVWVVLIASIVIGVIVIHRMQKVGRLKNIFDTVLIRIPYLGDINKSFSLSQTTRTLGLLVGSGVPIIESLKTSAEVATNSYHREAFLDVAKSVQKGIPLNVPISQNSIFPPVIGQMIAVGEETGKLEDVLLRVADYFETEASHKVRNFTATLEPVIIVFLAIGVLFVLVSVIIPLYQVTSSFGS